MEEPAAKRRRTSPRLSDELVSDAPSQPTTPSRTRRDRPSFASPTKASLSRHNPQILERRRSASSPFKPDSSRPASRRANPLGSSRIAPAPRAAPLGSTAENVAASEPQPAEDEEEDEFSRDDGSVPNSGQSVRRVMGGLAAAPRRSPSELNPRPLPAPGPETDDELNPFLERGLRRSPITGVPTRTTRPEPMLPPSVPDPISSTPPRGIHSSPVRPRGKNKVTKSSPLKPRPPPSPISREQSRQTNSAFVRNIQALQGATDELGNAPDGTSHPARNVAAFDPDAAKKKERQALREEIAGLEKDLKVAHRENERIRLMQTSGRVLSSTEESKVLEVVRRHLMPADGNARPVQSQLLMNAALTPAALLPFGRRLDQLAGNDEADDLPNIKSHYPIVMTADEELPYLQLFSPFNITREIAVQPEEPDEPLRQRHSITLRSSEFPGCFNAKVVMVVNAFDLSILELRVPALHPAAKAELGPLIERICTGNCNRSMQRNVGIMAWAMTEWHRVALQRAECWSQLNQEIASKDFVTGWADTARKKNSAHSRTAEDEVDEERQVSEAPPTKRSDLLRFIGQQHFEVAVPAGSASGPASTLRLQWKIEFDWTGEAQTKLAVNMSAPGKWHPKDGKGALGKLPKLFGDLIQMGEEPATATKTIATLLAGV